jgi:hypothetical protein
MPLNRSIAIGMSADSRSFVRDVYSAVDSLKALETGASAAQGAMTKFHFPAGTPGISRGESSPGASPAGASPARSAAPSSAAGELDTGALAGASAVAARAGSAIAAIGPQMATALQSGLRPISQIGDVVQHQLNIVGGVIEQLARRIESSMKMTTVKAGLTDLQTKIKAALASATTASAGGTKGVTLFEKATLKLGPAAMKSIDAYKGFLGVKSFFSALTSSVSGTGKSMAKLNGISLATPAAGATKMAGQFRTMAPAVNKVTTSVKGLGLQIGLALGVVGLAYKATQALVGFFASGIKGANNLNETVNKVKETFGAQGKVVTDLADQLGSKFGLVKGPILDAAASFGLIGKGAGMDTAAAAKMSVEMTKLAADVTSFYHIPMEEALQKIQSGLVGESKPLRDLGVLMTEDMVKAEALALGLAKGKGELDMHAKTMARASLITKGLATASGDLERTQHDTANQFLKAGGGISNFATTIGTMLLPVVKVAVGAFNELLASIITVFEENKPMIQGWVDTVKGAFDTTAMVLRNAGEYWTIFKLQTIENLSNVLAYVETIPPNLGLLASYIAGNWRQIIWDGINSVTTAFQNLGKNLGELANSVYQFIKDPTGGFTFNWTPLLDGFQATAAALPEMVKPNLITMQDEIAAAGQRIADREKARAASLVTAPGPAKPEAIKEKPVAKPAEYKATAAAEIGGSEAGSALAKFYNQGAGGNEAKATAKNTADTAKAVKSLAQAMRENKNRAQAQAQGLGGFPI